MAAWKADKKVSTSAVKRAATMVYRLVVRMVALSVAPKGEKTAVVSVEQTVELLAGLKVPEKVGLLVDQTAVRMAD